MIFIVVLKQYNLFFDIDDNNISIFNNVLNSDIVCWLSCDIQTHRQDGKIILNNNFKKMKIMRKTFNAIKKAFNWYCNNAYSDAFCPSGMIPYKFCNIKGNF